MRSTRLTDSGLDEEQRAAWDALELGPLWTPIAAPPQVMAPLATQAAAPASAHSTVPFAGGDWKTLEQAVASCRACGLCESRRNTVFGSGTPSAKWMVIGEAPGEQEDLKGEPFVGPAGQLLDAMMAAVGVSRETNLYIANTIKCRPPRNRDPSPEEMAACRPYLAEQIAHVDPALLILMGRAAVQSLLGTSDSIASLRGRIHEVSLGGKARQAVVTYHPAYLLRNLTHKDRSWRDLLLAKATCSPQASLSV